MDEPEWQVLVLVRGHIVRDACTPRFRESLGRQVFELASIESSERPPAIAGWRVHIRARAGVAAVLGTPPDVDATTAQAYADALVNAYAPPESPPFMPPASGGSGTSGAPALIAAYTPPRAPN